MDEARLRNIEGVAIAFQGLEDDSKKHLSDLILEMVVEIRTLKQKLKSCEKLEKIHANGI